MSAGSEEPGRASERPAVFILRHPRPATPAVFLACPACGATGVRAWDRHAGYACPRCGHAWPVPEGA
jgi:hypothetical protein